MAIKVYKSNGSTVFDSSDQIQPKAVNNQLTLTAEATSGSSVNINVVVGSITNGPDYYRFYNIAHTTFTDENGTALGATQSATITALQAILDDNTNLLSFVKPDISSGSTGTTKLVHIKDNTDADRDNAGTLELDTHSASIGLYGSYLKITEDDLNNTSGKNSAYGRLEVYLENAGTPVEVLDMQMSNTVQAPEVDLNTSSLDVSGDVTFSGVANTVTFSGDTSGIDYGDISNTPTIPGDPYILDGIYLKVETRDTAYSNDSYEGEVLKWGAASSMSAGQLRYMSSAGVPAASRWVNADADAESTTAGMLGIALGSSATTDGMFIKGVITFANSFTPGDTLYVSLTAAGITNDISSYTTGDIVRIVGYAMSTGLIYFNPSDDYVELS